MVITKQVRSKSGNQLEKRVLRQEKEGNIEGGEGEGIFEVTRLKGHPCTFSIYLMVPWNDLVS